MTAQDYYKKIGYNKFKELDIFGFAEAYHQHELERLNKLIIDNNL